MIVTTELECRQEGGGLALYLGNLEPVCSLILSLAVEAGINIPVVGQKPQGQPVAHALPASCAAPAQVGSWALAGARRLLQRLVRRLGL